jgi:uncharacterized protein (DUF2384 family)
MTAPGAMTPSNLAPQGELGGLPDLFRARLARRRREVALALDGEIDRLGLLRDRIAALDPEVLLAAIDGFGSPRESATWLIRPEGRLSGLSPIDVAATAEGKEQVIGLLLGLVQGEPSSLLGT